MSLRLEMLQVARLAPAVLGPDACELIERFVRSTQDATTGGFCDRDGEPDLYYTSFAIDALTALQAELPEETLRPFLETQLDRIDALDFVHRCCLARILSAFPKVASSEALGTLHAAIESFRTPDGGYNETPDSETGSAYAAFLAWGAYTDHGSPPPEPERIATALATLASPDGSWANDTFIPVPNVPATAAAITLYRNLRQPIPDTTPNWILGCFQPTPEGGGFTPFPGAPMPDLLTTAVALHALDGLQAEFAGLKEPILDFIDTLWTAEGGFYGTWDDEPEELDVEYTYYGLLALGHLAL